MVVYFFRIVDFSHGMNDFTRSFCVVSYNLLKSSLVFVKLNISVEAIFEQTTQLVKQLKMCDEALCVYIEGNIGAGKSTVIEQLRRYFDDEAIVAKEPEAKWPSLEKFYQDPPTHVLQLQKEVMESFRDRELEHQLSLNNKVKVYIYERSLKSSYDVFANINCNNQQMIELLDEKYKHFVVMPVYRKVIYIYIRTPTYLCLKNIQKRQKPTDGYIDMDYLERLEKQHDEIYLKESDCDCIVVDGHGEKKTIRDRVLFEILTQLNSI